MMMDTGQYIDAAHGEIGTHLLHRSLVVKERRRQHYARKQRHDSDQGDGTAV